MPSAETFGENPRIVALFVGPKHSGKTVAACSVISAEAIAAGRRVYDFDFDGRIRGLEGAPWLNRKVIDYDYYPPKTSMQARMMHLRLNEKMERIQMECQMGTCNLETIVADSLTAECAGLMSDAIPLTHKNERGGDKGKSIGGLSMPGPEDYGFEATGTYQFLAYLRAVPVRNIIVTAHVIDKFGKADPNDKYSESIVVGEKLSIRDKIGVNVAVYFDHIFRFDRRMVGGEERFFVQFRSSIACTSFPNLPVGEFDITGRNFYEFLMEAVRSPVALVAG